MREDGRGRLLCTLRNPVGTIIGTMVVASFFCLVGSVFLFSSLPHTELLVVERNGREFMFHRAQLLAGRWPLSEHTVRSLGPCVARVEEDTDEGTTRYRVLVDIPEGAIPYGKLKTKRGEVERQVEQLESFFRFGFETRIEFREDVWWWFLSFFGLFGFGIGLGVMGLVAVADRWTFDRATGTATHQRLLLVPVSTRSWRRDEITVVRHTAETDADGDTFHRLLLVLRTGEGVRMNATSHAMREAPQLDEAARRICSYLGVA